MATPPGWTDEHLEEFHALYRSLHDYRPLPVAAEDDVEAESPDVIFVEQRFVPQDAARPPTRYALLATPMSDSVSVQVYDGHVEITSGDFFVEAGSVVLTQAGLELLRFIQRHWPHQAVTVRYALDDGGPSRFRTTYHLPNDAE